MTKLTGAVHNGRLGLSGGRVVPNKSGPLVYAIFPDPLEGERKWRIEYRRVGTNRPTVQMKCMGEQKSPLEVNPIAPLDALVLRMAYAAEYPGGEAGAVRDGGLGLTMYNEGVEARERLGKILSDAELIEWANALTWMEN